MFWQVNKNSDNLPRMQPSAYRPVFSANMRIMKRLLIVALVALTGLVHAQKSENRSVSSFKGVRAAEGIDVYLKKGDKEAVRVEVTGVDLRDVITEVSGDYLKIHMEDGNYRNKTVKVYVTYVEVDKLSASSAANIFSESIIKTRSLSVSASSAGTVDVQIDVDNFEASASSAGDVQVKGKAKSIDVSASSAGEVDAYELEAENVSAGVSSGGSAKVHAVKSIEARASSGGSVRYRGNPDRSNTNSSSGGSVKKSS
jgi:hypothetical protein